MFRVIDAVKAVQNVENYAESIAQLGSTTLRSMLGTLTLSELLVASTEDDDVLNTVNEAADEWGIVVERIEVQNVRLPADLQQAMATEAEASRKAKAKLIHAKAEAQAAEKLSQAADLLSKTPGTIQLRYLQVYSTDRTAYTSQHNFRHYNKSLTKNTIQSWCQCPVNFYIQLLTKLSC